MLTEHFLEKGFNGWAGKSNQCFPLVADIFVSHIFPEELVFLELDDVWIFSQPPTEKVSLPLIHICTHAGMHDVEYKADVNEIKMKEGLGVTAYHNILLKN